MLAKFEIALDKYKMYCRNVCNVENRLHLVFDSDNIFLSGNHFLEGPHRQEISFKKTGHKSACKVGKLYLTRGFLHKIPWCIC